MPEWLATSLEYVGPFGVFCLAVLVLLVRDRRNNKAGNPGPPLTNGRWQQDMKQAQDRTNETLERIEDKMEKSVDLLNKMWGRQSGTE